MIDQKDYEIWIQQEDSVWKLTYTGKNFIETWRKFQDHERIYGDKVRFYRREAHLLGVGMNEQDREAEMAKYP